MPGNLDVWDLWQSAATQWRASGFGLIGLDYPAVRFVAGLVGVTLNDAVLQKLQVLEGLTLMSQMETAKKEQKKPSSMKGN
jgi:hypothetical protein